MGKPQGTEEWYNSPRLKYSSPPPPPFDLSVEDLSIGIPEHFLPFLLGASRPDNSNKTIIRNVTASCRSEELLAL